MPVRRPVYHGSFAGRRMLETYACETWKRFVGTGNDFTNSPTLDEQDALCAEDEEVFALKPVVAEVSTVDNGALLNVIEDND